VIVTLKRPYFAIVWMVVWLCAGALVANVANMLLCVMQRYGGFPYMISSVANLLFYGVQYGRCLLGVLWCLVSRVLHVLTTSHAPSVCAMVCYMDGLGLPYRRGYDSASTGPTRSEINWR
jgi:hypothetical protein